MELEGLDAMVAKKEYKCGGKLYWTSSLNYHMLVAKKLRSVLNKLVVLILQLACVMMFPQGGTRLTWCLRVPLNTSVYLHIFVFMIIIISIVNQLKNGKEEKNFACSYILSMKPQSWFLAHHIPFLTRTFYKFGKFSVFCLITWVIKM